MFDASRRPLVRTALQSLVLACGIAASAAGAQVQTPVPPQPQPPPSTLRALTPAPGNDAINRFLQERGLLSQVAVESGGLLDQVRDKASDLVLSSMNFLGVPYKRGGNSAEHGFDCSGFTRHIFEMSVGLVLPRRADEQAKLSSLAPVKKTELKPGDLVFFNTMRRTFSHVGIYVGEGKFIHAPRSGSKVRVEDMREAYWAKRFTGARRADLSAADHSGAAATLN